MSILRTLKHQSTEHGGRPFIIKGSEPPDNMSRSLGSSFARNKHAGPCLLFRLFMCPLHGFFMDFLFSKPALLN